MMREVAKHFTSPAQHGSAIKHSRSDVITYLLDRGADRHAQTNRGDTALDLAQQAAFQETVTILKDGGQP